MRTLPLWFLGWCFAFVSLASARLAVRDAHGVLKAVQNRLPFTRRRCFVLEIVFEVR